MVNIERRTTRPSLKTRCPSSCLVGFVWGWDGGGRPTGVWCNGEVKWRVGLRQELQRTDFLWLHDQRGHTPPATPPHPPHPSPPSLSHPHPFPSSCAITAQHRGRRTAKAFKTRSIAFHVPRVTAPPPKSAAMKIVAIALHRYQRDTPEPIILTQAAELESFGYFQRNGYVKGTGRRRARRPPSPRGMHPPPPPPLVPCDVGLTHAHPPPNTASGRCAASWARH